jgi:hypothetical protein
MRYFSLQILMGIDCGENGFSAKSTLASFASRSSVFRGVHSPAEYLCNRVIAPVFPLWGHRLNVLEHFGFGGSA